MHWRTSQADVIRRALELAEREEKKNRETLLKRLEIYHQNKP
jgi:Arc/MetJ-type ribon-helix-helix transcriptional regulator